MGGRGSTRAWRLLRAEVLERDGYVCRMVVDGRQCGARATTADHIIPVALGGPDTLDNLRAACGPCNYRAGGHLRRTLSGTGQADRAAPSARVMRLVLDMDLAGLPSDAGRRTARSVVLIGSASDIDQACAYRRARGPVPRASRAW